MIPNDSMRITWAIKTALIENYHGQPYAVADGTYFLAIAEIDGHVLWRTLYGPITDELLSQYQDELHANRNLPDVRAEKAQRVDGQTE